MERWWHAYSWRRVIVVSNGSGNNDLAALPNVAMALANSAVLQSPGRTWDGVEAMRFRPASEEISVPALSNHLVVLHLGPTVDVAQRAGGGPLSERLVGTGGSAVVPAGLASEWRWGGRGAGCADSLHLYLAPALIREAAQGVGVDPDRVEIVGSVGERDRQIERIGLSLLPELEAEEPLGGGLFAEALAVHLLREHSTLGLPDHMVAAAFTDEPDAALLPAERERVRELSDGGVLRAAYLSADRSEAWLVVRGDDPDAARNAMESLPLYPYLEIQGIAQVNSIAPPAG